MRNVGSLSFKTNYSPEFRLVFAKIRFGGPFQPDKMTASKENLSKRFQRLDCSIVQLIDIRSEICFGGLIAADNCDAWLFSHLQN